MSLGPNPKPLVVGIAGGSASGKTTLARRMAEALDGLQVHVVKSLLLSTLPSPFPSPSQMQTFTALL